MDPNLKEYVGEFIAESKEHITNLNNSILELEKDPKNKNCVNNIFRSFHTLKGNSAALGFSNLSELAHHLENVLAKIRDDQLFASENVIAILLEGIDNIDKCLNLVESESKDDLDFSSVVGKAERILLVNPAEIKVKHAFELTPGEKQQIESLKKLDFQVMKVDVKFRNDLLLKDAKARIILRNLGKVGTCISSNPRENEFSSIDDLLEIVVGVKNKEDIEKNLQVAGVEKITVQDFNEELLKAKPLQAEQKAPTAAQQAKADQLDISKETQSVRIGIERLDKLMEMVGELVIHRMRLADIAEKYDSKELTEILTNIDRLALNIQEEVIDERMVPIGQIYNKFPRMIRDLSLKEQKKVNFVTEGTEIKFDRTVLDEIGEPLIHILRNAIDHGIETPEERRRVSKPEEGTIKISARRERSIAIIEVEDDGNGIDLEAVKSAATSKGLITEQEKNAITDEDAILLVFNPGMSTSKKITEVSGRGVGMNVVKSKISSLGGSVSISSQKNKGTKISMHLPLTLAIIQALLVKVGKDIYSIPISVVELIEEIPKSKIKTIQKQEVFVLYGEEIPLIRLRDIFGMPRLDRDKSIVVIVEKSDKKIGLVVDEILREQQILIKTLNNTVKHIKGFAGATILGNGEVCLILDVSSLL